MGFLALRRVAFERQMHVFEGNVREAGFFRHLYRPLKAELAQRVGSDPQLESMVRLPINTAAGSKYCWSGSTNRYHDGSEQRSSQKISTIQGIGLFHRAEGVAKRCSTPIEKA